MEQSDWSDVNQNSKFKIRASSSSSQCVCVSTENMNGQEEGQRHRRKLPKPPLGVNSPQRLRPVSSLVDSSSQARPPPPPPPPSSSVAEVGQLLSFSPPGSKPREFLGYTSPAAEQVTEWEDSSVTVAVRVRPFSDRCAHPHWPSPPSSVFSLAVLLFSLLPLALLSLAVSRELRLDATQVVRMYRNETIITSSENKIHRFCYDHCFWSFDDAQAPHAGQDAVYTQLAQPLLDWAFEGYNTCLFAYGQVR